MRKWHLENRIFLVVLVLAVIVAAIAFEAPRIAMYGFLAFFAVALIYPFAGLLIISARDWAGPDEFQIPWAELLVLALRLAIAIAMRRPYIVYRPGTLEKSRQLKIRWGQAASVFLKAFLIFLIALGILAAPLRTDHDPFGSDFSDPGNSAFALQTRNNLHQISDAINNYEWGHQGKSPHSLHDIHIPTAASSPWNPSAGIDGYAYLPNNLGFDQTGPYLYDAIELKATGKTHAVFGQQAAIRVVSKNELFKDAP